MKVESKYNKGEVIFFMRGMTPQKGIISGITFFTGTKKTIDGTVMECPENETCSVEYHIENTGFSINEKCAYANKTTLQKALFENL